MSKMVIDGQTYWKDAKGGLTPDDRVKDIDKARDELVCDYIQRAEQLQASIKAFKAALFGDIAAFVELSADRYDAKIGGTKGNVTLYSYDGQFKIQRAISEHLAFDERIQAAKALIDECLSEWTENSRSEVKVLIERAFNVDKEGNLNTNRILALRRVDIKDSRWLRAMDAIAESIQVIGSKSYVRLYKRVGDTDQYKAISLDIAGV